LVTGLEETMSEEERNLEAVRRWADLYNEDVARMVEESYADEFEVDVRGQFVMHRRETFQRAEAAVVAAAPRRRARIERMIAAGDTVIVEAVLVDPDRGEDWQSPWCALLRLRDGKIVSDHTYLDAARWPGFRAPARR
jgi:ketosteroid isomerase-like protein